MKSNTNTTTLPVKPKGMSQAQYTYAMAKAAFDTIDAEYNRRADELKAGLDFTDDAAPDRYGDTLIAMQEELGLSKAWNLLREAEDLLLDWAREETKKSPMFNQHPEVLEAFGERGRRHPHRKTLVDICFKMQGGQR